jgi:hypothetical protein
LHFNIQEDYSVAEIVKWLKITAQNVQNNSLIFVQISVSLSLSVFFSALIKCSAHKLAE